MKRENGKDDPGSSMRDQVFNNDDTAYGKEDSSYNKSALEYNTVPYKDRLLNNKGYNGVNKDDSSFNKDDLGVQIVTPIATIKEFDIYEIHNYTIQGLKNKW